MNFLQPWLLIGLPLIALPIIIHLINQRRFQSVPWAAMMFLLAANRMSRGYARIRQWLILASRALAIAGLIFAIARPLASGWLGATGGGASDTAIVLLDRSPSMQQRGQGTPVSKLETGTSQLASALETLGTKRIVTVDSSDLATEELATGESLVGRPNTSPIDARSDIPGMLLESLNYVSANQLGQADVWICSDLRSGDWQADDGRWQTVREAYRGLENRVRFHLLAYPQSGTDNVSVQVTGVRRQSLGDAAEVLLSLRLQRAGNPSDTLSLPLEIEIEGTRSQFQVEISGNELELQDYRIPIAADLQRGWGSVSLPADINPADNQAYFVFDQPPARKTLIVSDDPAVAAPLKLAAGIAPVGDVLVEAEVRSPSQLLGTAWEDLGLVLWHAPLPTGDDLSQLEKLVQRGGSIIFFPPKQLGTETAFGIRWEQWQTLNEAAVIESWRNDEDLLRNTQSGQALPVGALKYRAVAAFAGEATPLATLKGGLVAWGRATTSTGRVYFCTTTPSPNDSTLASDGIVFYVAIQRALADGADSLSNTRAYAAGEISAQQSALWEPVVLAENRLSSSRSESAGVFRDGQRLLAVNRPVVEDIESIVSDEVLEGLFQELPLDRVNDDAGSLSSLVQEIWRLFLVGMMVAMILEAALCIPKLTRGGGIAR